MVSWLSQWFETHLPSSKGACSRQSRWKRRAVAQKGEGFRLTGPELLLILGRGGDSVVEIRHDAGTTASGLGAGHENDAVLKMVEEDGPADNGWQRQRSSPSAGAEDSRVRAKVRAKVQASRELRGLSEAGAVQAGDWSFPWRVGCGLDVAGSRCRLKGDKGILLKVRTKTIDAC